MDSGLLFWTLFYVRQGSCFTASDVSALKLTPRRPHAHGETSDNLDELYIVSPQRPVDQQSSVVMRSLPMVIHRSGTARTSSTGAASVFPSKPAELLGVFTGYMAGGPVFVYLEVCDHEVPLGMSPVIQATGRRIVHTWVWLHLMLTSAYCRKSSMRKWRYCTFKYSVRSFSGFFWFFRARKVQKLTARLISSELRAHQMSPSGVPPHWRSRRAHQPSCRSRRALEPIRAESTVVPLLSSRTQSSSTHRLWVRWARNQSALASVRCSLPA